MSFVTTHVLDTAAGQPGTGIDVVLERLQDGAWLEVARGCTDSDGRVGDLGPDHLASGVLRLRFDVGSYQERRGVQAFFTEVTVTFQIEESEAHYHVPLLLSPFSYSTYRGS